MYTKKWRDECVLFLDEGFSAERVAVRLRTAGFTVQRFPERFKDDDGNTRRNVQDPEVIRFCHKNGWLLVTTDHEMRNMHLAEIAKTEVAILATAHNSVDNPDEWTVALINLKSKILREFKSRERPWFATFSRNGEANNKCPKTTVMSVSAKRTAISVGFTSATKWGTVRVRVWFLNAILNRERSHHQPVISVSKCLVMAS